MTIDTRDRTAARTVEWMGTEYTIGVTAGDSAGVVGVFEAVVPAGEGPPVHVHYNEDEVIHIIDGEYEFWLDGVLARGGPGSSMFLPRGVPHTFRVVGSRAGRNLAILTPGGFEGFFMEAATANLRIPEDMAALTALSTRYGLEFRGPADWS